MVSEQPTAESLGLCLPDHLHDRRLLSLVPAAQRPTVWPASRTLCSHPVHVLQCCQRLGFLKFKPGHVTFTLQNECCWCPCALLCSARCHQWLCPHVLIMHANQKVYHRFVQLSSQERRWRQALDSSLLSLLIGSVTMGYSSSQAFSFLPRKIKTKTGPTHTSTGGTK